jgi:hypothetical protein
MTSGFGLGSGQAFEAGYSPESLSIFKIMPAIFADRLVFRFGLATLTRSI